jgi:hypothetical protein
LNEYYRPKEEGTGHFNTTASVLEWRIKAQKKKSMTKSLTEQKSKRSGSLLATTVRDGKTEARSSMLQQNTNPPKNGSNMRQQEIQFLWLLTEQIPLGLDYTGCENPKLQYGNVSDVLLTDGSGYTFATVPGNNISLHGNRSRQNSP